MELKVAQPNLFLGCIYYIITLHLRDLQLKKKQGCRWEGLLPITTLDFNFNSVKDDI